MLIPIIENLNETNMDVHEVDDEELVYGDQNVKKKCQTTKFFLL